LRKRRPKPHTIWHLDEVYLKIDGRMVYLWRAIELTPTRLVMLSRNLPHDWQEQRRLLGFAPA
jgi:transposase-like protein